MSTRVYLLNFIGAGLMTLVGLSAAAESKEYLKGDRPQQRGYSEACPASHTVLPAGLFWKCGSFRFAVKPLPPISEERYVRVQRQKIRATVHALGGRV
jgi:hypothetical protein